MSKPLALSGLLTRAVVVILGVFGVTDPAVSPAVQAVIAAGTALVVAVVHFSEHRTIQNADALSVAAAQAAQAAAQAAPANPVAQRVAAVLDPASVQQAMTLAGAAIESARAGAVATAKHEAPEPATLPAPAVSPDDYPTQQIGIVRDVPAGASR